MILVDANLLIYAFMEGMAEQPESRRWLDERLRSSDGVGLPWASLLAFVRIASNRKIFEVPATIERCWRQVERWLDADAVWIPQATSRHRAVLGELLGHVGQDFNRVPDAHLAALAIEHDLILCSSDRGFRRYPKLSWENPLADKHG